MTLIILFQTSFLDNQSVWTEKESRYEYSLLHLYGEKGSMKNYSSPCCQTLQKSGTCPYTDIEDLPNTRCLSFFQTASIFYETLSNDEEKRMFNLVHPISYFCTLIIFFDRVVYGIESQLRIYAYFHIAIRHANLDQSFKWWRPIFTFFM